MTFVLVDKEQLWTLIQNAHDSTDQAPLSPGDPIVILAVQAGLKLPGPMLHDTVPPAPPPERMNTSRTYRARGDPRLRCMSDSKVVFTSEQSARDAAKRISERQAMRAYLGTCGHWHVSRVKR